MPRLELARRLLKVAWAAPATLIGLLLAPFFRRRSVRRGVLLCEGASWPRRLGWGYNAMTLGHVVLCVENIAERVLDHELVHVRQYERWGLLLFPAYLLASLWALLCGGHFYYDNAFEIAARRGALR